MLPAFVGFRNAALPPSGLRAGFARVRGCALGDAPLDPPHSRLSLNPRHCRLTGSSNDYLPASAPQMGKTSFKNLRYHSPLEGESERSSRMAKADPVGGRCRRLRTAAPNGVGRCGGGQLLLALGRGRRQYGGSHIRRLAGDFPAGRTRQARMPPEVQTCANQRS